eukprot:gene10866-12077_t
MLNKVVTTVTSALPVLFLSHGGGPAHFVDFSGSMFGSIDRNSPSAKFMRGLSKIVDAHSSQPIKCILVVSGHWEERVFTVDYQDRGPTQLVYDYYGFPEETYAPHLTYPVKTDLQVADRIYGLIRSAGLPCEKKKRGFDHGTFIPLKVAYPEANIPVVQLSLKSSLSIPEHIRLGEILQPLRKEGVLIVASGQMTHNLGALRSGGGSGKADPRTVAFQEWVNTFLSDTTISNYEEKKAQYARMPSEAPYYSFAHPRDEHFTPMAVAFGAAFGGGSEAVETRSERVYSEVVCGNMAIDCFLFSSPQTVSDAGTCVA